MNLLCLRFHNPKVLCSLSSRFHPFCKPSLFFRIPYRLCQCRVELGLRCSSSRYFPDRIGKHSVVIAAIREHRIQVDRPRLLHFPSVVHGCCCEGETFRCDGCRCRIDRRVDEDDPGCCRAANIHTATACLAPIAYEGGEIQMTMRTASVGRRSSVPSLRRE